jgi:putative ABC transport system ATP-binding protein
MYMIQLQHVSKTYNGSSVPVHALWDVSLQVAEGEFVAVTGPSGSGKSTLLTILGAMSPPTQGRVLIDGIDIYSLGAERQADFRHEYVGFVFQQLQLLPYLTAQENILLALAIAPLPKADKIGRTRKALERVGLRGKEDRLPHQLSGGEQGRVAVARAIVNQPPLLLADEPTGNLDQATGAQVLDLMYELNDAGQTVIVVAHDERVSDYASRSIQILDGRIVDPSSRPPFPHGPSDTSQPGQIALAARPSL